eukprot:Blabericola_migrator_1__4488@NODE_2397_length_2827_cov_144_630072_g1501_i0_p1_GENE_NODE_2397_length_2827_cov_144_630072_g1501_i0NODE_2397_length_2827_cov_144_630072_g1501_i0_p1_ORF_typecomplete_len515_score36_02_NODE_2397_length_2827_cov_144_630072_g1501_i02181762
MVWWYHQGRIPSESLSRENFGFVHNPMSAGRRVCVISVPDRRHIGAALLISLVTWVPLDTSSTESDPQNLSHEDISRSKHTRPLTQDQIDEITLKLGGTQGNRDVMRTWENTRGDVLPKRSPSPPRKPPSMAAAFEAFIHGERPHVAKLRSRQSLASSRRKSVNRISWPSALVAGAASLAADLSNAFQARRRSHADFPALSFPEVIKSSVSAHAAFAESPLDYPGGDAQNSGDAKQLPFIFESREFSSLSEAATPLRAPSETAKALRTLRKTPHAQCSIREFIKSLPDLNQALALEPFTGHFGSLINGLRGTLTTKLDFREWEPLTHPLLECLSLEELQILEYYSRPGLPEEFSLDARWADYKKNVNVEFEEEELRNRIIPLLRRLIKSSWRQFNPLKRTGRHVARGSNNSIVSFDVYNDLCKALPDEDRSIWSRETGVSLKQWKQGIRPEVHKVLRDLNAQHLTLACRIDHLAVVCLPFKVAMTAFIRRNQFLRYFMSMPSLPGKEALIQALI